VLAILLFLLMECGGEEALGWFVSVDKQPGMLDNYLEK